MDLIDEKRGLDGYKERYNRVMNYLKQQALSKQLEERRVKELELKVKREDMMEDSNRKITDQAKKLRLESKERYLKNYPEEDPLGEVEGSVFDVYTQLSNPEDDLSSAFDNWKETNEGQQAVSQLEADNKLTRNQLLKLKYLNSRTHPCKMIMQNHKNQMNLESLKKWAERISTDEKNIYGKPTFEKVIDLFLNTDVYNEGKPKRRVCTWQDVQEYLRSNKSGGSKIKNKLSKKRRKSKSKKNKKTRKGKSKKIKNIKNI